MLSIFIWKRFAQEKEEPLSSTIRYDRGADWFSEEEGRRSYQLVALHRIPACAEYSPSVICYRAKAMPADWVGTDLLECRMVPYRCLKVSSDGGQERWERVDGWERCIVMDTGKSMEEQWRDAQVWMKGGVCPIQEEQKEEQAGAGVESDQGRGGYRRGGRGGRGGRGRHGHGGRGGGQGRGGHDMKRRVVYSG